MRKIILFFVILFYIFILLISKPVNIDRNEHKNVYFNETEIINKSHDGVYFELDPMDDPYMLHYLTPVQLYNEIIVNDSNISPLDLAHSNKFDERIMKKTYPKFNYRYFDVLGYENSVLTMPC